MDEESIRELNRLHTGPGKGEEADGVLHKLRVKCQEPASVVAARVREVMDVMLRAGLEHWPADDEWILLLPKRFVEKCIPEPTREEVEAWHAAWHRLSEKNQRKRFQSQVVDADWSLLAWVSLFDPRYERPWYWWNLSIINKKSLMIRVETEDYLFESHGLRWLLRACGAISIHETWGEPSF